jgi:GNAT superfamily N-acetyltransferase
MDGWLIERLGKAHQRSEFCCGKPLLDNFLRTQAGQYEKRRLGRTFVAVLPPDPRVCGYYTLASGAVSFEHVPEETSRKLPRHPVPVILLGRLAVEQRCQGQRLGEVLLLDALERCLRLTEDLGVFAVEVHALDDSAKAFYLKYGFTPLADSALHLYLPMTTIEQELK